LRNVKGNAPKSDRVRFLLGAAIGIAISVPVFANIEDEPVRVLFMLLFAAVMGTGQVLAGRDTSGARKLTRWLITAAILTFVAAVIAYIVVT